MSGDDSAAAPFYMTGNRACLRRGREPQRRRRGPAAWSFRRGATDVVENASQTGSLGSVLHAGIGGLLHPFATPVHVIALAGLALIAGRKKRSAIEVAFALGLAIGLGAIAQGARETPAADMLLAGALLCGLLTASGVTVPILLAAPLALLFGAALGLDSLPSIAAGPGERTAALAGAACGGVVALALMASLTFSIARPLQGILLRAAGPVIAAVALLALVGRWGGAL